MTDTLAGRVVPDGGNTYVPPTSKWSTPLHARFVPALSQSYVRHYLFLRYVAVNVHFPDKDHNAVKPLQVVIAVCDWQGTSNAWEFNLCDFRRLADPHDKNSLDYLADRGLHVDTHANHGVHARSLGALLLSSGLLDPRRGLSWITYTGAYHVAYLLKIIAGGSPLPHGVAGFVDAVRQCLGDQVYDVARMAAECPGLPVGLERIAAHLGFHPPWDSPKLAGAAGVRALQVFRSLEYANFGGNVRKYGGLLQGLQC